MDRNQAKVFYPIMQAFAEGRIIECRTKPSFIEGSDVPNDWTEMKEIEFWKHTEYRVKSEPTYRPFANAEECWKEMQKHQPFGWVKINSNDFDIIIVLNTYVYLNDISISYIDAFDNYTFSDGTTFGVKIEEDYNGIK